MLVQLFKRGYNFEMIKVTSEEIISQKVLPYDVFDEAGIKILSAGEALTPGKILLVRNHENLYKKQENTTINLNKELSTKKPTSPYVEKYANDPKIMAVNKKSKINFDVQVELKSTYASAMDVFNKTDVVRAKNMILEIRDKIIRDSQLIRKNVKFFSELKLLGKHSNTHPLNTAILSVFLANKLEYSDMQITEIALGALLHDIGKINMTGEITNIDKMSKEEEAQYKKHPIIGHRMIKTELKLNENVARIALQHHERMDGSGFPYGISSTMISEYAQIIAVCNFFDNMTSNATSLEISSYREALRELLKSGSKLYSPKPLYGFIHMLSYGDSATFEELKF